MTVLKGGKKKAKAVGRHITKYLLFLRLLYFVFSSPVLMNVLVIRCIDGVFAAACGYGSSLTLLHNKLNWSK